MLVRRRAEGSKWDVAVVLGIWLLMLSALAKLISLLSSRPATGIDPISEVSERWLTIYAIVAELGACAVSAVCRTRRCRGVIILTLGAGFLCYHGALAASGYEGGCPCLGSIWQSMGISVQAMARVSACVALYFFVVGLGATFGSGASRRAPDS
jgi:hypothetical protein